MVLWRMFQMLSRVLALLSIAKMMDKYGPIGDGGVCLLAATALIFRRFWRIDSIVVGLHLGVQMHVSKRSPLTPYQGSLS